MQEAQEVEDDGMVAQIAEVLHAAPLLIADLAERWMTTPSDRVFRYCTWQAIERYRAETGIQLVQDGGEIRACTPEEQLRQAAKRNRKSRIARRRAAEIAAGAAAREPALTRKAERMIEREVMREPTLANERRDTEDARLRALVIGAKKKT